MTWLWLVIACWMAVALPAALLVGRSVRVADQRECACSATPGAASPGAGLDRRARVAQLAGR